MYVLSISYQKMSVYCVMFYLLRSHIKQCFQLGGTLVVQIRNVDMTKPCMHVKCGDQQSQIAYKCCNVFCFVTSRVKMFEKMLLLKSHIQNNAYPRPKQSHL